MTDSMEETWHMRHLLLGGAAAARPQLGCRCSSLLLGAVLLLLRFLRPALRSLHQIPA